MAKAIANIASVSPFNNLPIGTLADQLGALKAQIADLETCEKALRDELIRRGVAEAAGDAFAATITAAVRWTIDTKAVKAEMGEAWWTKRCNQALVTTVAVKARADLAADRLAA